FLLFQAAAERAHRDIRYQRKRGRITIELAVVAARVAVAGYASDRTVDEAEHETAHRVRDAETDVAEHRSVECGEALAFVLDRSGLHFLQHPRMAADRALPEDHQAAGHDVRAFDRDRDRRTLPAATDPVVRTEDHALAAVHVHRV